MGDESHDTFLITLFGIDRFLWFEERPDSLKGLMMEERIGLEVMEIFRGFEGSSLPRLGLFLLDEVEGGRW